MIRFLTKELSRKLKRIFRMGQGYKVTGMHTQTPPRPIPKRVEPSFTSNADFPKIHEKKPAILKDKVEPMKKTFELLLTRRTKNQTSTMGELTANDNVMKLGFTLEDAIRPIKVWGKTAIPEGRYKVTVTMSNRFKKRMPLLHDVPEFSGVRIHGGNTHHDTHGCPLLGANTNWNDRVWNCKHVNRNLIDLLDEKISEGFECYITITNKF